MVNYTTVLKDDYENLKEDYRLLEEITEDLAEFYSLNRGWLRSYIGMNKINIGN